MGVAEARVVADEAWTVCAAMGVAWGGVAGKT